MKKKAKILIVDDNQDLLIALKFMLGRYFTDIRTEKNPNLIPSIIEKEEFDMYLLDMNFSAGVSSGNEGIFWMNRILQKYPSAIIVFITAFGDIELAVKAMKEGATDFIQKSWDEKRMLNTILAAFEQRLASIKVDNIRKNEKKSQQEKSDSLIFESESMKKLIADVDKVAKTDANVLILGENGTGKQLIAQRIHEISSRKKHPFIDVDLGAVTSTLFESELFGHVKGAFTDAKHDKEGRIRAAHKGSLFLDEIGNLELPEQAKLLSVLQKRELTPVGASKSSPIDIRLISATNKEIPSMINQSTFREDLYFRINTVQIKLPPLRERQEDIAILAEYFLKNFSQQYQKPGLSLSMAAKYHLKEHSWPGNIRELKHAIEKAVIFSETSMLKPDDFNFEEQLDLKHDEIQSLNLNENEKRIIKKAIDKHKGNMSATAKELGINRSTLYAKIKKYDL